MLTILGPAKTIDMSPHEVTGKHTLPAYLTESRKLLEELRKLSPAALKSLMKVSDKLAVLNFERIAAWTEQHPPGSSNQALLSFSGEVFNGLDARTLGAKDLDFAQDHVRILSGLYGVLRPLDLVMPYRLEMQTKLANSRGRNLYEFWKEIIPQEVSSLTAATEGKTLVNLASNEYFSSIQPKTFPHRIITPVFKEQYANSFRNVTIYAKKARGMMLRLIIQNRINDPEHLKAFDLDGYFFNADQSGENEWWFTR
ncbi:MAG: peroxide stress protein YaaA [Bacteroidales bacterium]|nr:peroxide stress protein YaaA [Bacteroidales bacterium]MDT8432541.1 peroxide stress protein YaaA [Bacteroidales bacterium]